MRIRTSVVVIHQNKILTFHGIDPISAKEYYFLPGGLIEDHETAPQAAERETLEETGYSVSVNVGSAIDREYDFFWNGKNFHCLTVFYLAKLKSPIAKLVTDVDYNKGTFWLDLDEIESKFSYSAEIFSAVKELVEEYKINQSC